MKLYKSRSDSDSHHQNMIPREDNNHRNCKRGVLLPLVILVAIFMNLSALVSVSRLLKDSQLFNGVSAVVSEDSLRARAEEEVPKFDKLLGGLLHPGFNERSCLSRYESVQYLKELKRRPSSSLISKLRSYEALHRRCGPYTESYNKTVELITSGERPFAAGKECKYVIWIPFNGLGNKILSLASAFLYAIVTNRVVLVAPMDHVPDLFCEPFPGTSWFLPVDFPVTGYFNGLDQNSGYCYGNLVKNNLIDKSKIPPFIFLNLKYDMDHYDELFFKDEDQKFLEKIPWLSMKSDQYFIPYLFLMQSFKKDVENMFPDKESVFHFLVRYLFHPTNPVWKLITRYHQAYLAGADEKIGIQVRVFDYEPGPFKHVLDQIISCTMSENILPLINTDDNDPKSNIIAKKNKTKAVLITSLSSWYADVIRDMYLQYPTETGEVIRVHQPSHEERQKENDGLHYAKALAEMYLLGMSDRLVTSGESTFGYVAQGLGGLRSWLMYKPENRTVPDPPCRPFISIEPCFHSPPLDNPTAALVPHVRTCEDRIRGLKLYPDIK
ncbi:PREDICTED: galactoside 2-alpha-L-fucosyltransferase-like [Ipomoea nil]|uniref:galactoside 2-alpha-L-fucosyltransferase-like n=1 Tax=Ipomoea nil TaxID=35883 RepID=UPI00090087F8|nr:PREDICTED: galactoside 2-alpha-L-fucosyltransferase-like [Ipomoea nil]